MAIIIENGINIGPGITMGGTGGGGWAWSVARSSNLGIVLSNSNLTAYDSYSNEGYQVNPTAVADSAGAIVVGQKKVFSLKRTTLGGAYAFSSIIGLVNPAYNPINAGPDDAPGVFNTRGAGVSGDGGFFASAISATPSPTGGPTFTSLNDQIDVAVDWSGGTNNGYWWYRVNGGSWSIDTGGTGGDPAAGTGGFYMNVTLNTPESVVPAVSPGYQSAFTIQTSPYSALPSGFTFLG